MEWARPLTCRLIGEKNLLFLQIHGHVNLLLGLCSGDLDSVVFPKTCGVEGPRTCPKNQIPDSHCDTALGPAWRHTEQQVVAEGENTPPCCKLSMIRVLVIWPILEAIACFFQLKPKVQTRGSSTELVSRGVKRR